MKSNESKGVSLTLNRDLLMDAEIPSKFWDIDMLTYFGSTDAMRTVNRYIRKAEEAKAEGVGLFIEGGPQSFKTFLLTHALKCLMAKGHSTHYVKYDKLVDVAFSGKFNFESYFRSGVFVAIDDVMVDPKTSKALLRFLKLRVDAGVPFLIASSATLTAINQGLGLECWRYLHQHCIEVKAHCSAESMDNHYRSKTSQFRSSVEGDV